MQIHLCDSEEMSVRLEQGWVRCVLDSVVVAYVEAVYETHGSRSDWVQKKAPLWYRFGAADHSSVAKSSIQPWKWEKICTVSGSWPGTKRCL